MQAGTAQAVPNRKIKVLIVDDSITICRFLEATFSEDPDLEVVGYALDPFEARTSIKALNPDVLTLDIEMPKMDGVTFLRNLMRLHPMPVVMFSSLTDIGASATLDSLQAGAVDFMPKHSARSGEDIGEYIKELVRKVKAAAGVQVAKPTLVNSVPATLPDIKTVIDKVRNGRALTSQIDRLVAVGASTGGPEALRKFTSSLSPTNCALVIGQHMPANFMNSFAKRIDSQSAFTVKIAEDGESLKPRFGYIAPGDQHLAIEHTSSGYRWKVLDSAKVSGHRPSVDVLFKSIASCAPLQTIGVLMTGMGDDGAQGLKEMRDAGGVTIIQDKASSVVWGMPGKAHGLNAHDEVMSLEHIAPAINKMMSSLTKLRSDQ